MILISRRLLSVAQAYMSIDAHIFLYQISGHKTVTYEMDDITKSRNVHKNHTFFLSILFESDEQGKSSRFEAGCICMLRISATCPIPKWSLRARCKFTRLDVYPQSIPYWEGLGRAKDFALKLRS